MARTQKNPRWTGINKKYWNTYIEINEVINPRKSRSHGLQASSFGGEGQEHINRRENRHKRNDGSGKKEKKKGTRKFNNANSLRIVLHRQPQYHHQIQWRKWVFEDGAAGFGGRGRDLLLPHSHPQAKGTHVGRSDWQGHSESKALGSVGAQY